MGRQLNGSFLIDCKMLLVLMQLLLWIKITKLHGFGKVGAKIN